MDKSGASGTSKSAAADLARYQAQWEKIHNDTIRQIKQVKEQEARNAKLRAERSNQSPRG
ncbi:hypothetical protein P175DRAFT_0529386 [Aspergillus ochraceoroseus IBT 24754]|uniref:Uncharacterized protein n=1 Tax=Aspergillus ochraceoroseus IBT 24754 TaxID=1392256 RepID=A0A2T5M1C5_9EURO|nr:uncharacterized protein P175DRAFT_0529386 [Aspergillus ochraceoroseus IBT 24754]PTU22335.1 hypothetical protein P175DRAFT_0529386 [Aspergillus ochraceoroseus IBT 24754]